MSKLEKAIQECEKHGDDRKEISMVYMNNTNLKTILAAAKMLPEMVDSMNEFADNDKYELCDCRNCRSCRFQASLTKAQELLK